MYRGKDPAEPENWVTISGQEGAYPWKLTSGEAHSFQMQAYIQNGITVHNLYPYHPYKASDFSTGALQ